MKGIHQEDTVNQDLITELRKEFGMVHDDFYMVLTDTDMKVKVGEKSCCCCVCLRAGVKSYADPRNTRKYSTFQTFAAILRGSHLHEGHLRLHRHLLLSHSRDGKTEEGWRSL